MAIRPKNDATPEPATPSVVPFFRRARGVEDVPEVPVGLPAVSASAAAQPVAPVEAVDLTGRRKIVLLIGPGRAGKTVLARWLGEGAAEAGRPVFLVAADNQNRTLATFFNGVDQPPSADPGEKPRYLEGLFSDLAADRMSAVIDLGGGDTALAQMLDAVPDLVDVLEADGAAVVAHYLVGPRVDDLASLTSFEARGFRPAATSVILNAGLADPTIPREDAFARVRRHSGFRAAVERGAVPLWMPRLDADTVADIEAKRLHFREAASGRVPEGKAVKPLGPFAAARVRAWLKAMETELAPIASWAP